jgi:curved DNA-binding protein
MAEDLYATLGVSKDADAAALKRSYRKLAKDLHPDRNPGNAPAEARFKAVNHAYEVLSDDGKRKLYDEFGEEGLRDGFDPARARAYRQYARQGGAGSGSRPRIEDLFGEQGGGGDVNDVFGDLFGRASRGRRRRPDVRGADLESAISIDFLAAARGTTLELRPRGPDSEPIKVRIPPGAEEGNRVRIAGQGGPSPTGGVTGDLILLLHVQAHPRLKRDADDLRLDVPITLKEAYHGAKIHVPTLDGSVTVKVPPRTQSGTRLRLRGKGIARKDREPGDLYVQFLVHLPTGDEAGPLIDQLEQDDPRADFKL